MRGCLVRRLLAFFPNARLGLIGCCFVGGRGLYDGVWFEAPLSAFMPNGRLALDSVLLCVRNDSSPIGRAWAATAAIKAVGGKSVGIAVTMVQSDAIEHDEKLVQADAYARAG